MKLIEKMQGQTENIRIRTYLVLGQPEVEETGGGGDSEGLERYNFSYQYSSIPINLVLFLVNFHKFGTFFLINFNQSARVTKCDCSCQGFSVRRTQGWGN